MKRLVKETCLDCNGTGRETVAVYHAGPDHRTETVACWPCGGNGQVVVRPDYLTEIIEEVGAV